MFLDESHVLIGQLGGMYNGDRARKTTLVEYGFRLPSALDNRPLKFEEFERKMRQAIFVSATPADYEKRTPARWSSSWCGRPAWSTRRSRCGPATHQVDDVLQEIRERVEINERVLITTLTKRMAEQLTDYLADNGVKVRYLHSDIDTVERVEILRDLRLGTFDVLVGINLLREGLDIPEVSLVAILDADKEGFLRSERTLIQTIGRAARNLNGKAILYADRMTDSMQRAIGETERRRAKQIALQRGERHHAAQHQEAHQGHDRRRLQRTGRPEEAEGAGGQRRGRGAVGEGPQQAHQAAREADARARAQPRVREGGAGARPAGAAARAGLRRLGARPYRADPGGTGMNAPALRVLMICMGNICRSPTAAGVLRERLRQAGLAAQVEVDSAGTHAHWHAGEQADARARKHALARGYDLSSHRARLVGDEDFERYDLILAMDWDNIAALEARCPPDRRDSCGACRSSAGRTRARWCPIPTTPARPPSTTSWIWSRTPATGWSSTCAGSCETPLPQEGNFRAESRPNQSASCIID